MTSPSTPQSPSPRTRPDGCPGTMTIHQATDGGIGRLRMPGGRIPAPQWKVLADLAESFGSKKLTLTSRGNLQIRGIRDSAAFAEAVIDSGLLPYPSHDKVRNILASPMSGRLAGRVEVKDLVADFDRALVAEQELAKLPGRILFAFDDGSGDVAAEEPDLGVIALTADRFQLIVAGALTEVLLDRGVVVAALMAGARHFQAIRAGAWRIAELPDGGASVIETIRLAVPSESAAAEDMSTDITEAIISDVDRRAPIGWLDQQDNLVTLAAGVRFGDIPASLARLLGGTRTTITVTPWRTILIHDLPEAVAEDIVKVLAPKGLIFDRASTWNRLSACEGRPGCAKSLSDVRGDAAHALAKGQLPDAPAHFSGCERRCGRPRGLVVDYVATGDGLYDVNTTES